MSLLKKLERFEVHHKILLFSIVFILTILFVRTITYVYDPNPMFFNVEIHHFDYGVILLLIVVKFLLFASKKYYFFYLMLAAIASGLILDQYVFIRKSVVEDVFARREAYDSTLPYVVISIVTGTLIVLFINSLKRRNRL